MTHTHEPGETASAPIMRLPASAPIMRLHLRRRHDETGIAVVMLTELQLNIAHEAHHVMERRISQVEQEAR